VFKLPRITIFIVVTSNEAQTVSTGTLKNPLQFFGYQTKSRTYEGEVDETTASWANVRHLQTDAMKGVVLFVVCFYGACHESKSGKQRGMSP